MMAGMVACTEEDEMDIPPYSGERDVVEADWNAPANPLADLQAFRKMLESQSHSLPTRQIYLTGQQAITAWERGDMSLQDSSVQILIPYRDAESEMEKAHDDDQSGSRYLLHYPAGESYSIDFAAAHASSTVLNRAYTTAYPERRVTRRNYAVTRFASSGFSGKSCFSSSVKSRYSRLFMCHFFDFGGSSPSCGTDGSSSPSPIPLPTTITPLDSSSRSRID